MNYFCFIILVLTLASCSQNTENGVEQLQPNLLNVHQDTVIGWTIEIPANWKIQTAQEIAAINEKGLESIEDAVNEKMDTSLYNNVLSFVKDSVNMFQSIRELSDKDELEWKKNNDALKKLFCNVYANQGARLDSSETTIEEIGGVKFQSYEILFYDDAEKINMVQVFYSALINGNDLSISMCASNEQNKRELMAIWENSIFAKLEK